MNDDSSLIAAARSGDQAAYAALYRGHARRALHEARKVVNNPSDAEDCVASAFASTFQAIRNGGGPQDAFRPYLTAATRNAALQMVRVKRYSSETTSDVLEPPAHVDIYEIGMDPAVRNAFDGLPTRWKEVLWKTEIEGIAARDIAGELAMSANSVAALAKRAREGFRKAYLTTAIGSDPHPWAVERLDDYRHGLLEPRQRDLVGLHLEHCPMCQDAVAPVPVSAASVGAILLLGGVVPPAIGMGAMAGGSGIVGRIRSSRPAATSVGIAAAVLLTLAAAGIAIATGSRGSTSRSNVPIATDGGGADRRSGPFTRSPAGSAPSPSPPAILPPTSQELTTTVADSTALATTTVAADPAASSTSTRPSTTGPAGRATVATLRPPAVTRPPAVARPLTTVTIATTSAPVTTAATTIAATIETTTTTATTTAPTTSPPTTAADTTATTAAAAAAAATTTTLPTPQYGGTLTLTRNSPGARTGTVLATGPDGLPAGTQLRFTFAGSGPAWSVTFATVTNCSGLPNGLSGALDLPQAAACTSPALAMGASLSVTFIVHDPSFIGDDNDAITVRLEAQRPGGGVALQCDPGSCSAGP